MALYVKPVLTKYVKKPKMCAISAVKILKLCMLQNCIHLCTYVRYCFLVESRQDLRIMLMDCGEKTFIVQCTPDKKHAINCSFLPSGCCPCWKGKPTRSGCQLSVNGSVINSLRSSGNHACVCQFGSTRIPLALSYSIFLSTCPKMLNGGKA